MSYKIRMQKILLSQWDTSIVALSCRRPLKWTPFLYVSKLTNLLWINQSKSLDVPYMPGDNAHPCIIRTYVFRQLSKEKKTKSVYYAQVKSRHFRPIETYVTHSRKKLWSHAYVCLITHCVAKRLSKTYRITSVRSRRMIRTYVMIR